MERMYYIHNINVSYSKSIKTVSILLSADDFPFFYRFSLSPAVGALYVRKYFNEKSKKNAQEIVGNIKSSFIDMLQQVSWMDESTKRAAVDKAKALIAHIAFPNELTNKTELENFYKLLTMNENEYFMNALRLNKFRTEYALRQLYEPVNKSDWLAHATPAMTNAFYSALENSIRMYFVFERFDSNNKYLYIVINKSFVIYYLLLCSLWLRRISSGHTSRNIFIGRTAELFELWSDRSNNGS